MQDQWEDYGRSERLQVPERCFREMTVSLVTYWYRLLF